MFNGVLRNLVTNTADDVAASAARKAMGKSVLSTIIPEERILQRAPEGFKIPAAAAQYLDNPQLPAPQVKATVSIDPTDPTAALKAEALKYKTAEEFVRAQGTPVFHGTGANFDKFDAKLHGQNYNQGEGGFHFTSKRGTAENYATLSAQSLGKGDKGRVIEAYIDMKKPLVVEAPSSVRSLEFYDDHISDIQREAMQKGSDGIIVKGNGEDLHIALNPDSIKTKQQLTDLYNQANTPQVSEAAKKYLNPQPTAMVDRYNVPYVESNVPVKQLLRKQDYQPRVTASGRGTENSVYTKGYNEGAVDQPMLVRKNGDMYEVLGGHSRTLGMERRAAEGLPNPEAIKARIYENITDEQAKQIARAANQGGQYESTLDMAKSISDSLKENVAPSVQKQNMTRGFGYDDYDYLWQTVQEDGLLREKLFQGALSQDDVLAVARHARQKGLEPQKAMGIITSLDKNGSFNKQNAKNVINLLTGKTNAGLQRDAQTGLFGDIGTAVNSVDLLKDFEKTSAELTRRVNAVKTVTGEAGLSDDVLRELDTTKQEIERKMKNITDEILSRYKAKQPAAIPQVLDMPDAPLEGQADIFGNVVDQAPAPAAPVKQRTITEAEQSKAPRKISVLKITDNTDDYNIPVSAKKYLPPIKTPVSQQAKPVAAVQAEIAALSKALPDQAELRKMTDQQIEEYTPSWREAMASILAIQATMGAEER